jgi:hypothetical protein
LKPFRPARAAIAVITRLPEVSCSGTIPGNRFAQPLRGFHAAEQSEPAAGRSLRLSGAPGISLAVLVARGGQEAGRSGVLHTLHASLPYRVSFVAGFAAAEVALSRQRANGNRVVQRKLAARIGPCAQNHGRRLIFHRFREPPNQLLPADGEALAAAREECQLVHRMALRGV